MELTARFVKLICVQNTDQTEFYPELSVDARPPTPKIVPTPDEPSFGSLAAVGVWLASIFFILVIPGFVLLAYLATLNPRITDSDQLIEFAKTDPTSIVLQMAAILPAHLLTLLLAWVVITRLRTFSFRNTLGWKTGGFRWWYYPIILGGFMAVAAVVSSYFPEQENDLIRILKSSRSAVYIVAFVATFTAPIVEEVVYRGMLYSAFQRTFGVPAAFLLVTFLFALVHVPQYYPSYSTIFLLALLSVTLTAIRVKTNNLLPCIILHTLFNGLQSIFMIIDPTPDPATVPQQAAALFHLFI